MLELRFLPARQGDAIWVRWGEDHQLIVDMGTEQTGNAIADRFEALPQEQRKFELLVVTHVDADHIGGVLTCVADRGDDPIRGLSFGDVWFNGWDHLHGRKVPPRTDTPDLEEMGPAQGERLAGWLRDQPWNEAFDRGPVVRGLSTEIDGLRLTVLGPTQARLDALRDTWKEAVELAIAKGTLTTVPEGLEVFGTSVPPMLTAQVDLELLAAGNAKDPSRTNATSIVLLLEWEGRRILLTGDALAADLVEAVRTLDGGAPVALDLVKVPHHGSRQNLSGELAAAIDCPTWLFSSDGAIFGHPDAPAIARLLHFGRPPHNLAFNVPSSFNEFWQNPTWQDLFGYDVQYGDPTDGLTITFDPA